MTTMIDRPTARHRATTSDSPVDPAPPSPFGGRYVSGTAGQPSVEGVYTGSVMAAATRGTYVTAPMRSPRTGGTYTYTG